MIEFWLGVTNINNAKHLKKSYGITQSINACNWCIQQHGGISVCEKTKKEKQKQKEIAFLDEKNIKLLGLFQPK